MNRVTDEWFACIAFIVLWAYILVRMIAQVLRSNLTLKGRKDWPLIIFWAAMYGYCLAALWSLGILRAVPFYGVLGAMLAAGTLTLCAMKRERSGQ